MVEFGGTLVDFTIFGNIVDDLFVENIHSPHLFVHKGKILDILSCVLDHSLCEWALLPKVSIVLHLRVDLVFFGIDLASVLLQEIVQTNVYISIIIMLKEI
jgi:hypothetical protein